VALFARMGLEQLLLGVLFVIVLVRYRAMIPLMYAVSVMGHVGQFALAPIKPALVGRRVWRQASATGACSPEHRGAGALADGKWLLEGEARGLELWPYLRGSATRESTWKITKFKPRHRSMHGSVARST
jgi:hypothetical protein